MTPEQRAALRSLQLASDLQNLMATASGRRVACWLIYDVAGLQDASFHEGSVTASIKDGVCAAMHMARLEGRRNVAIDVHNELRRVAPAQLLTMLREQLEAADADLAAELTTTASAKDEAP